MSELTLADLVQRIEMLERAVGIQSPGPAKADWQRVVGMFAGSDFMKQVDAEGRKLREMERANAQQEAPPE